MRGPMIGAVTAGWCSSQASADVGRVLAELGAEVLARLDRVRGACSSASCARPAAPRLPSLASCGARRRAARRAAATTGSRRGRSARHGRQHLELDSRGAAGCRCDCSLTRPRKLRRRGRLLRLRDVPAGEVATSRRRGPCPARRSDLHRLPDLVPRRVPVDVVHLVEVDVVGLQPPQADRRRPGGCCSADRRVVVGPVAHRRRRPWWRARSSRAARRPGRTSGR